MAQKQNETKVVSWFFPKKALIKFDDSEDSLSVSDKVMTVSDFVKYPVLKGDTVEVGIKDDEVAFLRKVKGAKKSSSAKQETPKPSGATETKEVRIFAVAGNKKVVKFAKDDEWIPVAETVQSQDYDSIGLVAGNTVAVTLEDGTITLVRSVETKSESTSNKTPPSAKRSSYRDEESTDKRTASMNAKDVVVALLNNKEITKRHLKEVIEDLTKTFYKITKAL